jgi:hypothetical protein
VWLVLHEISPGDEEEGTMSEPVDPDTLMCVNASSGCLVEGDGVPNYYVVKFTGLLLDAEGELAEKEASIGVAMLPDEAAILIRGLTELVATHDPNTLYDVGVVASTVPIPPQAKD